MLMPLAGQPQGTAVRGPHSFLLRKQEGAEIRPRGERCGKFGRLLQLTFSMSLPAQSA